MAECVYASIHVMRDPKGKKVADLFPMLFDDDEEYIDAPPITEDDAAMLQAEMNEMNRQNNVKTE